MLSEKPGKSAAIVQSNYIPWKGYFDLIRSVDEFILLDDVQYTRRDWRNRNLIKTGTGLKWLTIPVQVSGKYTQRICDTQVDGHDWQQSHWRSIAHNYAHAAHFGTYCGQLEDLYLGTDEQRLSRINFRFISAVCGILGITTRISWSMDYQAAEGKTERLIGLCQQVGADEYLSGPAAKNYLDENLFAQAGIRVRYADYSDYPEYRQLYPPFVHGVSIIDLILNEGRDAPHYLKRI